VEKLPKKDKHFIETFVENVIVKSPIEVYWKNEDGSRGIRICGCIRNDGRRCLSPAGEGTDHRGVGYCFLHDKVNRGKKGWLKLVAEGAKGTSLGDLIDKNEDLEVRVGEVTEEIRFQQDMVLWFINHIMNRDNGVDSEGNRLPPEFTKEDIRFLKELNIDMIKSKESAARIKGSMKLDVLTVKQFAGQILTFLFGRLVKMVGKAEAYKLASDMNAEVFAPMIAKSLISGEISPLHELPDSLKDLSIVETRDDIR